MKKKSLFYNGNKLNKKDCVTIQKNFREKSPALNSWKIFDYFGTYNNNVYMSLKYIISYPFSSWMLITITYFPKTLIWKGTCPPQCSPQHYLQLPRYGSNLSVYQQVNVVYIYTMEYYSAIKRMKFATTWMDLEGIMLSEMSDRGRRILCLNTVWIL